MADSLLTYFGNDSAFNNARARDTDATTAVKKKELCYNLYRIEIREDSLVYITYGVNSRKDYHGPETKDPDFDISLCEHDTFWKFVFDGEHLRFVRNSAAG